VEFTIRTVNDHEELGSAIDLLGTVFPEEQAFFQNRLEREPAYAFNTTWIAETEGEMASVVQIFPFSIWVSIDTPGSPGGWPHFRCRLF
jgi:hypothetical protein